MHDIRLQIKKKLPTFWFKKKYLNFFWILKGNKKLFRKNPKSREILPSVVSKASSTIKKLKISLHTLQVREKNKDLLDKFTSSLQQAATTFKIFHKLYLAYEKHFH